MIVSVKENVVLGVSISIKEKAVWVRSVVTG